MKELDRIEETRSAAADEGWISKIVLHALDQLGRSSSCLFHHPILSIAGETSSAAAIYVGKKRFKKMLPIILALFSNANSQ